MTARQSPVTLSNVSFEVSSTRPPSQVTVLAAYLAFLGPARFARYLVDRHLHIVVCAQMLDNLYFETANSLEVAISSHGKAQVRMLPVEAETGRDAPDTFILQEMLSPRTTRDLESHTQP